MLQDVHAIGWKALAAEGRIMKGNFTDVNTFGHNQGKRFAAKHFASAEAFHFNPRTTREVTILDLAEGQPLASEGQQGDKTTETKRIHGNWENLQANEKMGCSSMKTFPLSFLREPRHEMDGTRTA